MAEWAQSLVKALGGQPTPANLAFLNSWQRWEGGHTANAATFNWLNRTDTGFPTINKVGVAAYPDATTGISRTAALLRSGYPAIAAALKGGAVDLNDPAIQGDLNRWLTGKRTPGVTPYVSKIASTYKPGGSLSQPLSAPSPSQDTSGASQALRTAPVAAQGVSGPRAWALQALNKFVTTGKYDAVQGLSDLSQSFNRVYAGQEIPESGGLTYPKLKGRVPVDAAPIVSEAYRWLGTPYSWGGGGVSGPSRGVNQGAGTVGFDCSGFLQYLWAKQGVEVPHATYEQWHYGRAVSREDLQPGDAVFFRMGERGPEHVGMYIGDNRFIHAPHTGDVIKISSLDDDYYRRNWVGARTWAPPLSGPLK